MYFSMAELSGADRTVFVEEYSAKHELCLKMGKNEE